MGATGAGRGAGGAAGEAAQAASALTLLASPPYNAALMSADLPPSVDAWRAVSARRVFEGKVALGAFARLRDSLADTDGECSFSLKFGRDGFGVATVEVVAEAGLPLVCQRSLQRFLLPVHVRQTLGLIRNEAEEDALPPDVEPVLVGADGELTLLDLVEDELILALPVVPLSADTMGEPLPAPADDADEPKINPFAALAALKKQPS